MLDDIAGSANEGDVDASPEQLQKLREVINQDTTSAIVEGLVQSDPDQIMKKENEENEKAASDAAKDLYDDFGEEPSAA